MPLKGLSSLFFVCFLCAAALILFQNGVILAIPAVWGIWKATRSPIPHFTAGLFCGTLLLRIALMLALHPPLTSDFETLFQAARAVLAHDFSYQATAYFSLWAYQTAFVLWEAFWLLLWDDPLCLILVNAVLAAGIACLLYRLSLDWVGRRAAQAAALLLTVFPFSLTFHTVLSNQLPSAFFLTLAVWLLACTDAKRLGFWRFPLAGLALQLGNLLRNEGVIVLTAIFVWALFRLLAAPGEARRLLPGLAVLLTVYLGIHAGAAAAVRELGLNPYGLQNGDPMWKFVTGLNFESQGGYSDEDWAAIAQTLDEHWQPTPETEALQNHLAAERLSEGPLPLLHHARRKLRCQWISDGLSWALGHTRLEHPSLYDLARQLDRTAFFLALGLLCWGLPEALRQRDKGALLPYFIFFAAFCAFLLVEVQPRYAYLPQLFIFTGAALGIERLERYRYDTSV